MGTPPTLPIVGEMLTSSTNREVGAAIEDGGPWGMVPRQARAERRCPRQRAGLGRCIPPAWLPHMRCSLCKELLCSAREAILQIGRHEGRCTASGEFSSDDGDGESEE